MAYEPLNDIIDDVFVARVVASSLVMINILSRFIFLNNDDFNLDCIFYFIFNLEKNGS